MGGGLLLLGCVPHPLLLLAIPGAAWLPRNLACRLAQCAPPPAADTTTSPPPLWSGWNRWAWRGHTINWLAAGDSGPVVLLIHGFGASVYHWRYNVPELAKHCRVYAIDCLGFGWSDKPLEEYEGYTLWSDQITGGRRILL